MISNRIAVPCILSLPTTLDLMVNKYMVIIDQPFRSQMHLTTCNNGTDEE